MPSSKFASIKAKINQQIGIFLNFPDADSLQPTNQEKIRAFIVLSHAEIEWYFEQVALEAEVNLHDSRMVSGILPLANVDFFAFANSKNGIDIEKEYDLQIRSTRLRKLFVSTISNNHGIKGVNLLTMFLPLGVDYHSLPSGLIQDLDTYGTMRGEIAHKDNVPRITVALGRDNVESKTNQILANLESFDRTITATHSIT